jgi:hypothetical protein
MNTKHKHNRTNYIVTYYGKGYLQQFISIHPNIFNIQDKYFPFDKDNRYSYNKEEFELEFILNKEHYELYDPENRIPIPISISKKCEEKELLLKELLLKEQNDEEDILLKKWEKEIIKQIIKFY